MNATSYFAVPCYAKDLRSKSKHLPIGFAVRADFRRLYPANAKTPTCCPSDDNRTKVTNSVTSARSLWWQVGPYFWPADLTRTANPIKTFPTEIRPPNPRKYLVINVRIGEVMQPATIIQACSVEILSELYMELDNVVLLHRLLCRCREFEQYTGERYTQQCTSVSCRRSIYRIM